MLSVVINSMLQLLSIDIKLKMIFPITSITHILVQSLYYLVYYTNQTHMNVCNLLGEPSSSLIVMYDHINMDICLWQIHNLPAGLIHTHALILLQLAKQRSTETVMQFWRHFPCEDLITVILIAE